MDGGKSAGTRWPDDLAPLEAAFVATAENLAFYNDGLVEARCRVSGYADLSGEWPELSAGALEAVPTQERAEHLEHL